MVLSKDESPIYDTKISTVGPGYVSGQGAVQELTSMDLAMKLHFLKTVYYFKPEAFEGLTIINIKETLFNWMNHAFIPCGRLRRADSGRPYIKCNDCGMRLIEARCKLSLDQWLESKDDSRHKLLVPNQVLGPELPFSPLVLMQLTKFACGATSVGISWAHILGDAVSATGFVNLWGQASRHQYPSRPLSKDYTENGEHNQKSPLKDPLSIKRVGPLGDHWVTPNDTKLDTCSFYISWPELTHLQSKICGDKDREQIPPFESICTVFWKCIAKVKQGSGVNIVTVCKRDSESSFEGIITNRAQSIKVVKTDSSIEKSSPMELGLLIMNQGVDERRNIENAIETNGEFPDFLVYGANLTFVDFHGALFYDLDIRGNTPVYVNCAIDNVGDEGVVLFLPTQKDQTSGMTISVTLPQNHISELKSVLKKEWSLS